MVQASELMIGNYVWRVSIECGIERCRWYERIDQIKEGDDLSLPSSKIEPVKLTLDVLAKCGFTINENVPDRIHLKIGDDMFLGKSHIYESVILFVDNCQYGISVKYLHQLQNLYFSLTGRQLEVKI